MGVASYVVKKAREQLKAALEKNRVTQGTQTIILFVFDNAQFYVTWCMAHKKDPSSPEALKDFLYKKGVLTGKFAGDITGYGEITNNIVACIAFLKDIGDDVKYSEYPFGVAIALGLIIQDFGKFINEFSPAQRAYYELFLKTSEVRVRAPPRNPSKGPILRPL